MNITIVSLWAQKLFRPDESLPYGGAELQLVLLARELMRQFGVSIRFITRGQGPLERFDADGIKVVKLPYRKTRVGRTVWGIWDLYRTIVEEPSDMYVQRGGGIETGVTGWASKRTHTPFLFMSSSAWDVDGTHARDRGWMYGSFYLSGLKQASAVIAQSEYQQERLRTAYQKESIVLRSAHQIPETVPQEKKGVLWVGRCEPVKSPFYFLDMVRALPDIPFTMVCPKANSEDMMVDVTRRALELPNLTFIPGTSFEETEKLFANHRLFVCTSEKEGFPNTYVQAAKWGTPIVSRNVNPDEILTKHGMGYCAEGGMQKQIETIQRLNESPEAWNRHSNNARQYAVDTHDIKAIAAKLYQQVQALVK